MISRQRVANIFALFALCSLLIGKSQAGLSEGFEELSNFLEKSSNTIDGENNLELINKNLNGLGRDAKRAVSKLSDLAQAKNDECAQQRPLIYAIQRYEDKASSEKMNNLFAYASEKFYKQCMGLFNEKLIYPAPFWYTFTPIESIREEYRDDFMLNRLIDVDFIEKYKEVRPSYFEDFDLKVSVEDDIGPSIFTDSRELLRKKIAEYLRVKESKLEEGKIKEAERVSKKLAVACVDALNLFGPQMKYLRVLQKVSSRPGESPAVKLADFTPPAQDVVFRVKYCEDLARLSKSKTIQRKVYKMFKTSLRYRLVAGLISPIYYALFIYNKINRPNPYDRIPAPLMEV